MGMAYAAVCTVDNLANGLDEAGRPLDAEELAGTVDAGRPALLAAIDSAVAELAA
jgi:purine nucleoside phosphorylase